MVVILYQVCQVRGNVSDNLNLLYLSLERKVKCYTGYFINEYVFHIEKYGQDKKTYNNRVCVKRSTSNKFEVDYYKKLEEVIELQYHSK